MKIVKCIIPKEKYSLKCPYAMTPTRIVVHNTANDASAIKEITYMINNNSSTGFHYAVDDIQVVQGIPENRNAFHCGDGRNGIGNRQGIGIEICYSKSGGEKFTTAEKNASKFIAQLLIKYGWSIDQVTKHQDYSGKYCPHRTLDLGWNRFLNMIKANMPSTFKVRVNATELNYRAGAGIQYKINGTVKRGEVYTIVETNGSWGKLKSGAGWMNLKYCDRI